MPNFSKINDRIFLKIKKYVFKECFPLRLSNNSKVFLKIIYIFINIFYIKFIFLLIYRILLENDFYEGVKSVLIDKSY